MNPIYISCPVRRKPVPSLRSTVVVLVGKQGSATADDLLSQLPGYSRRQILSALQNARYAGLLDCDGPRLGGSTGRMPGIYRPVNAGKPGRRALASIWEMGARTAG